MDIDFSRYPAVLLDLDGTVYHEDSPLPGGAALVRLIQTTRVPFACLTNSTSSPQRLVTRLNAMGIALTPEQIYTAASASADYVLERFGRGAGDKPGSTRHKPWIFNLATEGVDDMLQGRVNWVVDDTQQCDAIIIGAPANAYAGEERQRMALRLLRKGALPVGICADRLYPSARGFEFGSGALTAMLCFAANTQAVFCGKPEKLFFNELCRRLRIQPAGCLLIGDNLESDIAGAKQVGMKTILTLTGVARRRDLQSAPAAQQPDAVIEDLTELLPRT